MENNTIKKSEEGGEKGEQALSILDSFKIYQEIRKKFLILIQLGLNKFKRSIVFQEYINKLGNYGIVGKLVVNLVVDNPIHQSESLVIFKFSNRVDYLTDHEVTVLKDLTKVRKFLPHVVGYYGDRLLPISETFFDQGKTRIKNDPFNSSSVQENEQKEEKGEEGIQTIPQRVLFQEYIKGESFYSILLKNNQRVINSQLLQLLLVLEVAQNLISFVHYDLHAENILLVRCSIDDLFLFKIRGRFYLVPTFGYYPKIFDAGLSYSVSVATKKLCSSITNYHQGFQPVIFDPIQDIHHLLLSTFYLLEEGNQIYSTLSNLTKIIFSSLPIWRRKGWKDLPHDIERIVLKKISIESDAYSDPFFANYDSSILAIINSLISLPFVEGETSFILTSNKKSGNEKVEKNVEVWSVFLREFNALIKMKSDGEKKKQLSPQKKLHLLKVIVETIQTLGINIRQKDIQAGFDQLLNFEEVKLKRLSSALIFLSKKLSANYYYLLKDHQALLNRKYLDLSISSPLDLYLFLAKNLTPHFIVTPLSNVYLWDADTQSYSYFSCRILEDSQLKEINELNFLTKGEKIAKLLRVIDKN